MRSLKLIIALAILILCSSCAIYHHYGPYYGKVIDEETKKPLEGVVILANYYTWLHASPGGPAGYFLDALEVVTDKNGEFRIPSLNAFAFRPLSTFNSYPDFRIFKPHYKCYLKPMLEDEYETVELLNLKTKEERIANLRGCYPVSVPDNKMRKFIELENVEDVDLGLSPRPIRKE